MTRNFQLPVSYTRVMVLCFVLLLGAIPSNAPGLNPFKLGQIAFSIIGCGYLLASSRIMRFTHVHSFLLIALLLQHFSLFCSEPVLWVTVALGFYLLAAVSIVVLNLQPHEIRWLIWFVLIAAAVGTIIDIYFDLVGIGVVEGGFKTTAPWTPGQRGVTCASSGNGVALAFFAAAALFAEKTSWRRTVFMALFGLAIVHVLVIGEGRSNATGLGVAILINARTRRQFMFAATLTAVAVFYVLFSQEIRNTNDSGAAQLMSGFLGRVDSQKIEEVDRWQHMRVGLNLISGGGLSDMLIGQGPKAGLDATNGEGIHSMLIGMAVCFGIPATIVFAIAYALMGYHAVAKLANRAKNTWQENGCALYVFSWVLGSWGGPVIYNFRPMLLLGATLGIVLYNKSLSDVTTHRASTKPLGLPLINKPVC